MAEEDPMIPKEGPRDDAPPSWLSIPPGVDQLVVDDGEPLESLRHRDAMSLLIETLSLHWEDRRDFFVGGNQFLYFSMTQTKKNDFRGPDVYVVLGTEKKERKAWVLWEEDGKRPTVVIELTSESTRAEDYGRKKDVYERALEVPYYFISDPFADDVAGFRLSVDRKGYEPIARNAAGRFPVELLGLELGIWRGSVRQHYDASTPWLRWFEPDGTLLESGEERAVREAARAAEERARADDEKARADDEKARADAEKARADDEKARANAEKARADREAQRAAELERRVAELERSRRD